MNSNVEELQSKAAYEMQMSVSEYWDLTAGIIEVCDHPELTDHPAVQKLIACHDGFENLIQKHVVGNHPELADEWFYEEDVEDCSWKEVCEAIKEVCEHSELKDHQYVLPLGIALHDYSESRIDISHHLN